MTRIVMTTWHAEKPLYEAIWFGLNLSWPDEGYLSGCEATLGVAVGAPEWAAELRDAFRDPRRFTAWVVDQDEEFDESRKWDDAFEAVERDAEALVAGLTEEQGTWRAEPGSWSVAECLDHLATANRIYLQAMLDPANRARAKGRTRHRPAKPGWVGRLFVRSLEPPPRWWSRMKAPRKIRPRPSPPLAEAFASFMASQADVRAFLDANVDLDLAGIRFPNPFIPGIRFSLATGLHVIAAHDRRHLWQAWRVRQAMEDAEG